MGGSWAEALRRDPAPLPPAGAFEPTAVTQKSGKADEDSGNLTEIVPSAVGSENTENAKRQGGGQLKTLVVDTNAIIKGTRLDNVADNLVTITEVFEEIKDKQTRQLMATLPYTISTREPSDASLKEVVRFARATGDLHSLSAPDIKLIALTYTLEAELYGTAHLRKEPPPIAVAKKAQGRIKDPPGWGKVENPSDWAGIDEVGDDGKRPGSSRGGNSRILGVKALDLGDSNAEKPSEEATSMATSDVPETPLKEVTNETAEVSGRTEKESVEGANESEMVQLAAESRKDAPSEKPAAWGGFTVNPVPVTPSESISLGSVEEPKQEKEAKTSQSVVEEPQKEEKETKTSVPRSQRGKGYCRGANKKTNKAATKKQIAVDGVHAVLVEEQAIEHSEEGDGWERNVSRSTRRKHQRRADRTASESLGHADSEKVEAKASEEEMDDLRSGLDELNVSGQDKEERNGAEKDGVKSEEKTEANGTSAKDAELGGQFSDPEEDDDLAEETNSAKDEGSAEQTNSADDEVSAEQTNEASDHEEYEYVYQNEEAPETASVSETEARNEGEENEHVNQQDGEAPETASVAETETKTESEANWDRASSVTKESDSEVACMTSDFAMQNVLLQMGLRLLSVDGLGITQVHRWALRCQACGQVTHEMGRIFCPKCGNGGTLNKVTIMVGEDGALVAGIRKRFSLRGTRYPIPLPKGGREGKQSDPILREDQLPSRIRHGLGPRKKKGGSLDVFGAEYGPETWFQAASMKGVSHNAVHLKNATAAFSSRKNPNERRVARKK